MNAKTLAKHYDRLTAEERFRLILAASGRGDETERDRLVRAGDRTSLSMSDHAPYARAFDELALLTFIDLLEEAARYHDAVVRLRNVDDKEDEADELAVSTPAEDDAGERPLWQRTLDLALAAGYVLRTKAEGWKRFCERLNIPPFLLWEGLPGFERLQRALSLADQAAFAPEGFLRWLNAIRPAGQPELTAIPLTATAVAEATEEAFRQRVQWWRG